MGCSACVAWRLFRRAFYSSRIHLELRHGNSKKSLCLWKICQQTLQMVVIRKQWYRFFPFLTRHFTPNSFVPLSNFALRPVNISVLLSSSYLKFLFAHDAASHPSFWNRYQAVLEPVCASVPARCCPSSSTGSEAVLSHLSVLLFYLQQVAQKRLKADADGLTGWILHTDRMCISAFIS